MIVAYLMSLPLARVFRSLGGVALILWGVVSLHPLIGIGVGRIAIGLFVLASALANISVLGAIFGGPLDGRHARQD